MKYADNVIVLENGKVRKQVKAKEFFEHPEWMEDIGINPPAVVRLKKQLKEQGFEIPDDVFDERKLADIVASQVSRHE